MPAWACILDHLSDGNDMTRDNFDGDGDIINWLTAGFAREDKDLRSDELIYSFVKECPRMSKDDISGGGIGISDALEHKILNYIKDWTDKNA